MRMTFRVIGQENKQERVIGPVMKGECPCFVLRISHDIEIIMSLDVISDLLNTAE